MAEFVKPEVKTPEFKRLRQKVADAEKLAADAVKTLKEAKHALWAAEDDFNHTLEGAYACGHGVYSNNACCSCGSIRNIQNGALYFDGVQVTEKDSTWDLF